MFTVRVVLVISIRKLTPKQIGMISAPTPHRTKHRGIAATASRRHDQHNRIRNRQTCTFDTKSFCSRRIECQKLLFYFSFFSNPEATTVTLTAFSDMLFEPRSNPKVVSTKDIVSMKCFIVSISFNKETFSSLP